MSAKLNAGQPARASRIALLAGQKGRRIKSITQPKLILSIILDMPPDIIKIILSTVNFFQFEVLNLKFEIDFESIILNFKLKIKNKKNKTSSPVKIFEGDNPKAKF